MFVTGEGGTGKSEVIKHLVEYTRLYFGKQKGLYGSAMAWARQDLLHEMLVVLLGRV